MLNKITGEIRIFTREVEIKGKKRVFFNACVGSSKDSDDKYINAYVMVEFAKAIKDKVPYTEECFDAIVSDAWFNAYKDKDGHAQLKLFVNKAKFVTADEKDEEDEEKSKKAKSSKKSSKKSDDDDSLPF